MIETKKTGIDVGHDLVQRVDLSTDQGRALRGILGYTKCLSIVTTLFNFDLLFSNLCMPVWHTISIYT